MMDIVADLACGLLDELGASCVFGALSFEPMVLIAVGLSRVGRVVAKDEDLPAPVVCSVVPTRQWA